MDSPVTRLNISDRRERLIVAAADALLWPLGGARRALVRPPAAPPRRILCLRLERVGDLLMTLPALALLRALAPQAVIDLIVGSWNADLARALTSVDRIETVDARWLSRAGRGFGLATLIPAVRRLKGRRYDLAINFEPDIRSNLILAAAGARRLAGFVSGGGGALLDTALEYDSRMHTSDNAVRLVQRVLGSKSAPPSEPLRGGGGLSIPDAARANADRILRSASGGPLIGIHVSGGRLVKQWPEDRFREVAQRLIEDRRAVLVLTGAAGDRLLVDIVKTGLPSKRIIDICGQSDLPTLAAVLQRLDLFVTGDTGPMHLAHAVGTPTVAIFGPSDPVRYAPRGALDRVVRIDLPCAPCNRIRRPPARCVGHTPDCLAGVDVQQALSTIDEVLQLSGALKDCSMRVRESSG